MHNLVGSIQYPTTYTKDYTAVSPLTLKTAIYNVSIHNDEKAPVCAQKEAIHKTRSSYYTTFKAAECEARKFILSVVEYTWVWELKWDNTYYTLVTAG